MLLRLAAIRYRHRLKKQQGWNELLVRGCNMGYEPTSTISFSKTLKNSGKPPAFQIVLHMLPHALQGSG